MQAWDGGGTAPVSSVNVTWIPRQYLISGWLGSGLLAGDQDGKWEGNCLILLSLSGPFDFGTVHPCGPPSGD